MASAVATAVAAHMVGPMVKDMSTVALDYLMKSIANKLNQQPTTTDHVQHAKQVKQQKQHDIGKRIREQANRLIPTVDILTVIAILNDCKHLRLQSTVINNILHAIFEQVCEIHFQVHIIYLELLEHEKSWTERPYYGLFSFFEKSIDVSNEMSRIQTSAACLQNHVVSLRKWLVPSIQLDAYNKHYIAQTSQTSQTMMVQYNEKETTEPRQGEHLHQQKTPDHQQQPPQQQQQQQPPQYNCDNYTPHSKPSMYNCDKDILAKLTALTLAKEMNQQSEAYVTDLTLLIKDPSHYGSAKDCVATNQPLTTNGTEATKIQGSPAPKGKPEGQVSPLI